MVFQAWGWGTANAWILTFGGLDLILRMTGVRRSLSPDLDLGQALMKIRAKMAHKFIGYGTTGFIPRVFLHL